MENKKSVFDLVTSFQEGYEYEFDGFPLDEYESDLFDNFFQITDLFKQVDIEKPPIPKIMTFNEFNKYIYSKIDPNRAILVTKEMLLRIEKAFLEDFAQDWVKLTRDHKRKKERVIQGLYENVNIIYPNLESNPTKYLRYAKESILSKYVKEGISTS